MKRLIKVFGILILLIIIAALVLPFVFEDEITARAKQEINKSLTAEVDFEDVDISLFRSFPDFSLSLENITVDGKNQFGGVRLAKVEDFTVDLNLFSVISGNQYEVERIWIENADIHVVIDTAGNANYDIMKESGDTATAAADTATGGSFQFTLQSYGLQNVNVIYDDRAGEIFANIKEINHEGSGDFSEKIVELSTNTTIKSLSVRMAGITYIDHATASADADFVLDQDKFEFTFKENSLSLNELMLNFDGTVAMPEEDISMNLTFNAPENNFKNLLSLIPAVYSESFEDVQTEGQFSFNGSVKGTYSEDPEAYPQFDVNLEVSEASFRYPDLPASVNNINIKGQVYSTSEDLSSTVVKISQANADIAGSPVSARLMLSNPIDNPTFDAYLRTNLDLSNIGKVVPATGFDYRGTINADVELAGDMASIENENYQNIKADGNISAKDVVLKSDSLPYDVRIADMDMQFTPQAVQLNSFQSQLGRSDLSANGRIDNLMGYALKDQALKGSFSLQSTLLDLNQLAGADESADPAEETGSDTAASQLEVIRIPENLNFEVTADIQEIIYDNLNIKNTTGKLLLENGKVSLQNMTMNVLDGQLALDGSYDSKPAQPTVDVDFKINGFSFKQSYEKLVSIKQLAPIMKYSSGTYSTGFSFMSKLQQDMTPDFSTVQAQGSLNTKDLETSPKSLEKLAGLLNNQSLSNLDIGDLSLDFKVENGRTIVEPFDFKAGDVKATVSGSSGLDQSLDYKMTLKLPVQKIGAEQILQKIGASTGTVDLDVLITGTFTDPKISTSLGDLFGNVVDNLKETAREKVEEAKQEAVDKINEKAQQLIADAEKRGDELIAEAQQQTDKIMAQARSTVQNLKDEAYQRASKLEEDAKGNFLKEQGAKVAADKIRNEADEKADNILAEAQRKADNVVEQARQRKEKLVEEARQKGQVNNP